MFFAFPNFFLFYQQNCNLSKLFDKPDNGYSLHVIYESKSSPISENLDHTKILRVKTQLKILPISVIKRHFKTF